MQSNQGTIAGWNSTDDAVPVPVRSSTSPREQKLETVREDRGGVTQLRTPDPKAMTASAVLGIMLAIGGVVMYLGLDIGSMSLTGNILEDELTVSVTEDGTFSPDALTLRPGQTVTIENRHADPQVLKSKDSRELFAVQVIFDTPYVFTVPSDAAGEYVYFSETLPEDRTVIFTVRSSPSSESDVRSSESSAGETIPIDGVAVETSDAIESPTLEKSSSSSSVSSVLMRSTSSADPVRPSEVDVRQGTVTIAIGNTNETSSVSSSVTSSAAIAVNPYTVGASTALPVPVSASTRGTPRFDVPSSQGALHSGAPLVRTTYTPHPRSVPATGLPGFALFFLPAFGAVFCMARKRG